MDPVVVTLIVGLLATPLATIVVFFTGRKKYNAESQAAIAEGASTAVEAITSVLESLREELDQTKQQLSTALKELQQLRLANEKLIMENKELQNKVQRLTEFMEKGGSVE